MKTKLIGDDIMITKIKNKTINVMLRNFTHLYRGILDSNQMVKKQEILIKWNQCFHPEGHQILKIEDVQKIKRKP